MSTGEPTKIRGTIDFGKFQMDLPSWPQGNSNVESRECFTNSRVSLEGIQLCDSADNLCDDPSNDAWQIVFQHADG